MWDPVPWPGIEPESLYLEHRDLTGSVAQWKGIFLPMLEKQEMQVQSLGWEDPLEEEMATHSSILA